jgi:hypothetical protein
MNGWSRVESLFGRSPAARPRASTTALLFLVLVSLVSCNQQPDGPVKALLSS